MDSWNQCVSKYFACNCTNFRPAVQNKTTVGLEKVFEVSGQIVNELWCLTTENWMSFIQRPINQADSFEVEWLVGPIPKVIY